MQKLLIAGRTYLLACLLALPVSWAQTGTSALTGQDVQQATLLQGLRLMKAGQHRQAIDQYFDQVIAHYEQNYRKSAARVYSSRSAQETLAYTLRAENNSGQLPTSSATVYSAAWGDAYYLKAYALIELRQFSEAKTVLRSAIALAPLNAQYLGELGALLQMERDWDAAMPVFKQAEKAAREFSSQEVQRVELTRALRGQGFILIEQGKLDDAEKQYLACLEIDPNDVRAKNQMAYIAQRRKLQQEGLATPPSSKFTGEIATVDQAWNAAQEQNAQPTARSYMRDWLAGGKIWNDNGTHKRAVLPQEKATLECITAVFPSPESVRMVFQVNKAGVVTNAYSDQTGYVSECMQNKIVGHRIPAPPHEPFYICAKYEKRGASGTAMSSCGPSPIETVCERLGASTRCSIYQR